MQTFLALWDDLVDRVLLGVYALSEKVGKWRQ